MSHFLSVMTHSCFIWDRYLDLFLYSCFLPFKIDTSWYMNSLSALFLCNSFPTLPWGTPCYITVVGTWMFGIVFYFLQGQIHLHILHTVNVFPTSNDNFATMLYLGFPRVP